MKKRLVLCAYGITTEDRREMISFRQVKAESEAQWEAFLQDLYQRGLGGKRMALVIGDGNLRLCLALNIVYLYVTRQRCWVHKLRNLATRLPKRVHEPCLEGAKAIYQVPTHREAVGRFRDWACQWHSSQPKAVMRVRMPHCELK